MKKILQLTLVVLLGMVGSFAYAQDSTLPRDNRLPQDAVTGIVIGQQGIYFKTSEGKLRPVSSVNGLPSAPADGAAVDAFGRMRVSNATTVFQNKNIHSKNDNRFEERVGGAGTITFNANNASAELTVGTGATDFAVRQSIRYMPYVPGKSQRITQSFLFPAAKTGVNVEVGYGDDLNGIFLGRDGLAAPRWFVRSNTSGSPVEAESITQAAWNIDTLDGSGNDGNPSGILLDLTKTELSFIDFQWQGVGRIRVGFVIGGNVIYVHESNHANINSTIFMRTPSLPVRGKIYNTEITASPTTFSEICYAVESEGGFTPPGLEFSALANPLAASWRATSATRTPIFAIRMVNTVNGLPNRKTVNFIDAGFAANGNSAIFEVVHVHDPSAITATWNAIGGGSVVEWSEDITAITGNPDHIVNPQFVQAGTGNRPGEASIEAAIINEHSLLSQNFESTNSQAFVIYATAITGVGTAWSHITWNEFD